MTNADLAVQYIDQHWPVAPVFHTGDGGFELAGSVIQNTGKARAFWRDHPQASVALYCSDGFASLELPAYLGLRLFEKVGARCPTAVTPTGELRWQFIVRPDDALTDPQLIGDGRLHRECVFRPIVPHQLPYDLSRLWRRSRWLIHPRETLWEPGDGRHLAVNLRRIAGESARVSAPAKPVLERLLA